MSITIYWAPSADEDIYSYTLQTSDAPSGPWSTLAVVVHNLTGEHYDTESDEFFYTHTAGTADTYYRMYATDDAGQNSAPSSAFQGTEDAEEPEATVKIDHNYGGTNALRYQTASGIPIDNAVIRIFAKTAYDRGDTSTALATTRTASDGTWVTPIYLPTGFTYVVHFAKEGLYGPNKQEIVV